MKLKIDGKYKEIGFGSFIKFHICATLIITLIFYGGILLILFLIGLIFG